MKASHSDLGGLVIMNFVGEAYSQGRVGGTVQRIHLIGIKMLFSESKSKILVNDTE